MFDTLGGKLQDVFRTLRGQGSLSGADVDQALRQIRLALLEADVHFKVVKQFLDRVRVRATGQEVLRSLTPAQAVIRIVRDEMVALLGGDEPKHLQTSSRLPSIVLMTGLQGSGKTTTSAKLGRWLAKGGNHPLLAMPNVVCMPHLAWADRETFELYFGEAFRNVADFFEGRQVNVINQPVRQR